MATFTQVKNGWRAQVRRKAHKSIARTFNTKAEAEKWALQIESKMGIGTYVDNRETLSTSLSECLDRYASEIIPHKKGAKRELGRVELWKRHPITEKPIGTIKQVDIAKWRDERLATGVSGTTVKLDLALLSHLFTIAIKEWGYPLTNPVAMIRKPKSNPGRERRLEHGEEVLILENSPPEMRAFFIIAIETAMRRGEIHRLQRSWIRGRAALLPDTKNGTARAVPLSKRAIEAINSLPFRIDGRLFGLDIDAYTHGFLDACKRSGVTGLRLHDLRHEATSRLFEKGLDIMQVKSITGHKSLHMLNRYTHLRVDELAELLG